MKDIINIIHNKLNNKAIPHADEERFVAWLSSVENREAFDSYKKLWELTGTLKTTLKPNVNSQWERFKSIRGKSKNSNTKIRKLYKTISAVAAVAVIMFAIGVVINNFSGTSKTYISDNSTLKVQLPDNSLVLLNKNSTLNISKKFNNKTRTVKLTGEALFKVEKNKDIPFIIETEGGVNVKVLGTKFNLRAYGITSNVELKVLSGIVLFEKGSNNITVNKGMEVNYNHKTNSFSELKEVDNNLLAWQTKQFEFNNTPIDEVIVSLERFINKKIELPANTLDLRYTGTFDDPSDKEIADVLALSMGWDYKISKGAIKFTTPKGKK